MRTSKQARRGAKELFRACQINGLMDETRVRQVVTQVLEAKPRGYPAILHYFQRLVKLELDRRSVRVESARPLPADQQDQVQANLTRLYGAGLSAEFVTSPQLVGGLRIRVGSDVYDGSIYGRLQALQEQF